MESYCGTWSSCLRLIWKVWIWIFALRISGHVGLDEKLPRRPKRYTFVKTRPETLPKEFCKLEDDKAI